MSIVYLNGEFLEDNQNLISHSDSGFTTGIGIFDSMLALDGQLIHGSEHFERIIYDTKTVIGLKPNMSFDKFNDICQKLFTKNNLEKNYVRVRTTITGGNVKAPLLPAHTPTILIHIAQSYNPEKVEPISCAIISDYPRIAGCKLENCKRLDYSRSYAARRAAEALGAEEAILTNTNGDIACGATSNIFIEENGTLIPPPLIDGVLSGVPRRKIIQDKNALEETISLERLKKADKSYLTNSFIGLRQIQKIL